MVWCMVKSKEVCFVVQSVNIRHDDLTVLDALAHKEVTACNMFGLLVLACSNVIVYRVLDRVKPDPSASRSGRWGGIRM